MPVITIFVFFFSFGPFYLPGGENLTNYAHLLFIYLCQKILMLMVAFCNASVKINEYYLFKTKGYDLSSFRWISWMDYNML